MNNFSYKAFPLSSKLFHECSATTRGHGDDPVSLISHSALFSVISPPALNGLGLSKHKVVNESRWSLLSKPALLTDSSPATLASLLFQKHTGQTPTLRFVLAFLLPGMLFLQMSACLTPLLPHSWFKPCFLSVVKLHHSTW